MRALECLYYRRASSRESGVHFRFGTYEEEIAGDAALLVDPYSIESIRNGVMKLIKNHHYRDDLIKRGLENIERFKLPVIVRVLYGFVC